MRFTRGSARRAVSATVLALVAGLAPTGAPALVLASLPAPTSGFLTAVGTHLEANGQPFMIHGAAIYNVSNPGGPGSLGGVLDLAEAAGLNTIRIVNFFDERGLSDSAPYNETDWAHVDSILVALRARGMRAILDLSAFRNHLVNRAMVVGSFADECAPGAVRGAAYDAMNPYKPSLYPAWDAFLQFAAERVNTVNGVAYSNDPTIGVVSIAGEPAPPGSEDCGKPQSTQELTDFYAHAFATYKTFDSSHLVSNGGFIHLDWEEKFGNPSGSGIDWQAIFGLPENDLPSIHTYPGLGPPPVDYQTAKVAPYVAGLGKPWFTEEFGFTQSIGDATRAADYQWVYDLQSANGSSGAAFWNLGTELSGGSHDANPNTPLTWQVIQQAAPPPPAPPSSPSGVVYRDGQRLMLNGNEYRFSGVNMYNANSDGWCNVQYSDAQLATAFDTIGQGDNTVVRAWFFQSMAAAKTPGATHMWSGDRDWTRMDRTMDIAAAHNVRIIPTLTDNWGECGDGVTHFKNAAFYSGGYLLPDAVDAGRYDHWVSYRDWVTEVVNRYKNHPALLMWQLINEAEVNPNAPGGCPPGTGPGDILKEFARDVSNHVRTLDADHLISLGTIGSGQCGAGSTGEYKRIHDLPNIDVCELHDYDDPSLIPGDPWNGMATRIQACRELNKPLFVGEFGLDPALLGWTLQQRADNYAARIQAQAGQGVVGHLAWEYFPDGVPGDRFVIRPADPALDVLRDGPAWIVNSTSDSDDGKCDYLDCTLREAIKVTNANRGRDTIGFDFGALAAPAVIALSSDLPALNDRVVIDGTTEPEWGIVEVDGSGLPPSSTGLVFVAGNSRLAGLAIGGFDGFFGAAVVLSGAGHTEMVRNAIGLRADMSTVNANWLGVRVVSPQNVIGRAGAGNVLAGNDNHGIQVGLGENPGLDTHGNVIQANVIGYSPGPGGTEIITAPNGFYGIELNSTTGTLVGGSGPGEGNTISGNLRPGVVVDGPANTLIGNRIGTDVTGTVAVPNSFGILVNFATDTVIGGAGAGEGNLVSGNAVAGIQVNGPASQGTTILGNLIGTDATGNAPLPNGYGILFTGTGSSAGGVQSGSGNVISGNTWAGVLMGSNAIANSVVGNLIGMGADGATAVANGSGVVINENAHDNMIGDSATGAGNVIAHNTFDGVSVTHSAHANRLAGNSIFANGDQGIDIDNDGPSPNDLDDLDGGPNNGQNSPVLSAATSTAGVTSISGMVDGAPGSSAISVEFYSSTSCDPSGFGEGETSLGSVSYSANGAGDVSFAFDPASVNPAADVTVGQFVTAVATSLSPAPESSEFSNCIAVTAAPAGPDSATANVPAGGSVTTDSENDGATPADPVETTVTSVVAGAVSITENPTAGGASGYSIIGFDIAITAPPSTAANPIRIRVRLDASAIPAGQDETTIQLLRNGVALLDCSGPVGVASPDPCLSARTRLGDGDIELTALTSAASKWQLATVAPYTFTGFTSPVANAPQVNKVNSGQSVPIKFGLAGNPGLGVLATGWPKVGVVSCANPTATPISWISLGSTGVAQDGRPGKYSFVWKTDKAWAGTCRQLELRFDDGSRYVAIFNFTK